MLRVSGSGSDSLLHVCPKASTSWSCISGKGSDT